MNKTLNIAGKEYGTVFLAPMAGMGDASFRRICKEHGADYMTTEMVSAKALCYKDKKTPALAAIRDYEMPIAIQIFGSEPETMAKASEILLELSAKKGVLPAAIDVNMGCPVQKVVRAGSGSALMKTPDKIYTIVKTLTDNINKPITVKIRTGWDHSSINCVEVAKIIEKAGASAIAIHGRTRSDMYTGSANLDYIKAVKEAVSIPVIGNGDIKDITSAIKMKEYTGCDALMIGRAACGNPWIFKEISTYFDTQQIIERPKKEEIIEMMLLHAKRLILEKGEYVALVEMRTHAAWYLKQLIGTKIYKPLVVSVKSINELEKLGQEIINNPNVTVKPS